MKAWKNLLVGTFGGSLLLLAATPLRTQTGQNTSKPPDPKTFTMGSPQVLGVTPAPRNLPKSAPVALRGYAGALLGARPGARVLQAGRGTARYFVLRTEFDSAASRANLHVPGVSVLTAFDRFVELFIPANAAGDVDQSISQAILYSPGFRFYDFPEEVTLPPPSHYAPGQPSRVPVEEIVRGGLGPLTGKGVIVAVIDSGIDFRNPDFITYDSAHRPTSRLLYFWDTLSDAFAAKGLGSKPPYTFPNGQPIGTLFRREQLTAELRSGTKKIPATDEHGHGTAAASVAVGNGNNSEPSSLMHKQTVGVAPDADIIAVRIGGSEGAVENEYLLNAIVEWLDQAARSASEPMVVSCSFGGQQGGHDGNSIEERELSARFDPRVRGRAIVIAAGNEQQEGLHSNQQFEGKDRAAKFEWESQEGGGRVSFLLRSPGGAMPSPDKIFFAPLQAAGQNLPLPVRKGAYMNPISKDFVAIFDTPPGWSGLALWNEAGEPIQADAYILGGEFYPSIQTHTQVIGTPGTAEGAITVGSYDWNDKFEHDGQLVALKDPCLKDPMHLMSLSCYSSIGYSRAEGSVKPDLVAPGEWYAASYAHLPDGSGVKPDEWAGDSSGKYILFNGTSAATPYTAGVVALIMQQEPDITLGKIKDLLHKNATNDDHTGPVPNGAWGYGKLDLAAVRRILNMRRSNK